MGYTNKLDSLSGRRLSLGLSGEGRRQLCSVTPRMCVVRRTYSIYGDRCFAGPNCGTSFQLNCDKLTLASNDLSGY